MPAYISELRNSAHLKAPRRDQPPILNFPERRLSDVLTGVADFPYKGIIR
jgi:hypothetical protein